jgi:hypothetical protein
MPRQQRQHFAVMLAAARWGVTEFFPAATSASQRASAQTLGGELFCGTVFSLARVWHAKIFFEISRAAGCIFEFAFV